MDRPVSSSRATRPISRLLVENLLSNAVKYSPRTTPVEVRITRVDGEALVEVLDRGIGLDGETATNLVEPFYRSESARKTADGLGIGLALCQLIIEALDGRLWARPRQGGGAVVGFAMPIASEALEAS